MTDVPDNLLDRVRKLLDKAASEGVTPAEAEALTGKAAEMMAKYGIDRARLAASRPETDKPGSKAIFCDNPWGREKSALLGGLAKALRCQAIATTIRRTQSPRVMVYGYASDLERLDILFTSLLLQMTHAVIAEAHPGASRAWRHAFLLGFAARVAGRVQAAEDRARIDAENPTEDGCGGNGASMDLVLASREELVAQLVADKVPDLQTKRRTSYVSSTDGLSAGRAAGARADIGGTKIGGGPAAIGGAR